MPDAQGPSEVEEEDEEEEEEEEEDDDEGEEEQEEELEGDEGEEGEEGYEEAEIGQEPEEELPGGRKRPRLDPETQEAGPSTGKETGRSWLISSLTHDRGSTPPNALKVIWATFVCNEVWGHTLRVRTAPQLGSHVTKGDDATTS